LSYVLKHTRGKRNSCLNGPSGITDMPLPFDLELNSRRGELDWWIGFFLASKPRFCRRRGSLQFRKEAVIPWLQHANPQHKSRLRLRHRADRFAKLGALFVH